MIPYDELDRALARWKARTQSAAKEFEESGPVVLSEAADELEGLPAPPDRTGEIDLGDGSVETYEDDKN
jgi:hypothetical protein